MNKQTRNILLAVGGIAAIYLLPKVAKWLKHESAEMKREEDYANGDGFANPFSTKPKPTQGKPNTVRPIITPDNYKLKKKQ